MSSLSFDAGSRQAPTHLPEPRLGAPLGLASAALLLGAIACLPPANGQSIPGLPPAAPVDAASVPADSAQAARLPTVTVDAPRPAPSASEADSTLGASDIAPLRVGTSDTARLLGSIAGGAARSAGGVSSLPVIDGLADDRLHVEVDGMAVMSACANHMNPPLSYIDPSHVATIEVYSGIAPVSVGADSIGGAVLVKSAAPVFARPGQGSVQTGEAGAFFRSNGAAAGANLSATLADSDLSLSYSGSTVKSGNYTAGGAFKPPGPAFAGNSSVPGQSIPWLGADEVGSSAYQAQNQELGIAMRRDHHLLELRVGVQRIPEQGFPNQRMDMVGNDSTHVDLRYTGRYDWGTLQGKVYSQTVSHSMNFGPDKQFVYGSGASLAQGMPMDTSGGDRGTDLTAELPLSGRDTLRVGTSYQNDSYSEWWPPSGGMMMAPGTFWTIDGGERDRFGLWGEWDARWSQKWTSQIGVRSDRVMMNTGAVQGYNAKYDAAPISPATTFNAANRRHTDQNWNWTALTSYTPDAMQTYSVGYARKVRSPNLHELYTWSTSPMAMEMIGWFGDGNGYVGNLELSPETAHTVSATADWHAADGETWGLKVTPYATEIRNYIGVQRCPTAVCGSSAAMIANLTATKGFVDLQFVNQSARLYGIDVSAHALLAAGGSLGRFTATGLLSQVSGRNTTTGDNLYGMMPLNAKLAIQQDIGNWSNTVEAQLVSSKTQVSAVHDEVRTGGYALLNLRTSYAWKNVRFDLGIDNALNRFYALPLGGAYLGQGATMATSGPSARPWGIAVPGMGRSVNAAVSMKF